MANTREKSKQFKDSVSSYGLVPASIEKLIEEDFDTLDIVVLLTIEDVDTLGLARGQNRLLVKWLDTLRPPATPAPTSEMYFSSHLYMSKTNVSCCDIQHVQISQTLVFSVLLMCACLGVFFVCRISIGTQTNVKYLNFSISKYYH